MKNTFTYKSLAFSDIPLMHQWFNLPHVQQFYSLRQWSEQEVLDKHRPYINNEQPVSGFIVLMNELSIGYMQHYKSKDYPRHNLNLSEEIIDNAAGIDLFIGDKTKIRKGIGSQMIKGFIESKIWPQFKYCIVDPDTKNTVAIRCYEKLNFQSHAVIEAKDELNQPTLLNVMILKRKV